MLWGVYSKRREPRLPIATESQIDSLFNVEEVMKRRIPGLEGVNIVCSGSQYFANMYPLFSTLSDRLTVVSLSICIAPLSESELRSIKRRDLSRRSLVFDGSIEYQREKQLVLALKGNSLRQLTEEQQGVAEELATLIRS